MRKTILAVVAISSLSLGVAGCTTSEGAVSGGVVGAAIGGFGTRSAAVRGIGAGIGALTGAVLVNPLNNGYCTYRLQGPPLQRPLLSLGRS